MKNSDYLRIIMKDGVIYKNTLEQGATTLRHCAKSVPFALSPMWQRISQLAYLSDSRADTWCRSRDSNPDTLSDGGF